MELRNIKIFAEDNRLACFSLFTFTVFNSCFKFYMNMNTISALHYIWLHLVL